MQQMVQLFEQGKVHDARKIHLQLIPLFKALFITANPIPLKAALRLQGWQVGNTRPPLTDQSLDVDQILRKVMEEMGLLPV